MLFSKNTLCEEAHGLSITFKPSVVLHTPVESTFSRMAKRRVAKIMGETCCLYKIKINLRHTNERVGQKLTDGPSYLTNFNTMR